MVKAFLFCLQRRVDISLSRRAIGRCGFYTNAEWSARGVCVEYGGWMAGEIERRGGGILTSLGKGFVWAWVRWKEFWKSGGPAAR